MSRIRFEPLYGPTLERLHKAKQAPIDVIPTPFPTWNAMCGEEGGGEGLARRWVIVVGGVTGTGKSYLTMNLAAHAARLGHKIGMANFEMSQMAVATRYLSILTGLPKWRMEMGKNFSNETWLKAKGMADAIYRETGGCLISNESNVFSIDDIEASYEQLVKAGCRMVVVDYAQLVTVGGAEGIFQRSEKVAYRLRELTHEYDTTTIVVSQFNREEAKSNKPPSMHGLMGGGAWEHSANQIWLLNHMLRAKYGSPPRGEYTELLDEKNRHGLQKVALPMKWDYETMRFDEYAPGTDDGDPFGDSGEEVEVGHDPKAETQDDTRDLFDD